MPDNGEALPLDKCFILREGSDLTLITWGAMVKETLEAAEILAQKNISAEVIDVATVKPIDIGTIIESVEKTGRVVIIHEAARHCGVGAEIAAQIGEYCLDSLLAPIQRVTGYDTVMPYLKMEKIYIPSAKQIVDAATSILEFS